MTCFLSRVRKLIEAHLLSIAIANEGVVGTADLNRGVNVGYADSDEEQLLGLVCDGRHLVKVFATNAVIRGRLSSQL